MNVTTKDVLKYTMLPGFIPRIADLFSSGFSNVAFFMAFLFRMTGLIPYNHPYLIPENLGRYGMRHVIGEAYRHLEFKKENIDRILIFFIFLVGVVVLFMQLILFFVALAIPYASAGVGAEFFKYFGQTTDPTYDMAFIFLDRVFGYKDLGGAGVDIFNSCVAQAIPCLLEESGPGGPLVPSGSGVVLTIPTPFHIGLHRLLHFYNMGVLAVALIIFLYLVVTVVGETTVTGTPFGKRFNRFWAPVRMIVALALLFPVIQGLNMAQLMTLYVAKWGSNLATNAWVEYVGALSGETPMGNKAELVATPTAPSVDALSEFLFVAEACKHAEQYMNQRTIESYIVVTPDPNGSGDAITGRKDFIGTDYTTARDFSMESGATSITVRYGEVDDDEYKNYKGYVKPICGDLQMQIQDIENIGAFTIQEGYYNLIQNIESGGIFDTMVENVVLRVIPTEDKDPFAPVPDSEFMEDYKSYVRFYMEGASFSITIPFFGTFAITFPSIIQQGVDAQVASPTWDQDFLIRGWGGAAIWYNKIAEYNGSLISSAYSLPVPSSYPSVMEHVYEERQGHDNFISPETRFNPVLSDGQIVDFERDEDAYVAMALHYAQSFWIVNYEAPTGNIYEDAITAMFGLGGLFDMTANNDIHPMAKLVAVGRGIIESAVTNFGFAFGAGIFGGLASMFQQTLVGSVGFAAASFAGQVALIGLSIGFILYYIVPFLPFIYFFFALGGWIKGIFEAMVGLPLWGIAHIRIDGEGLPGPVAMNGYYLIFEIFIRPVLTVFGLIAGIIIFAAQVDVLHEIWQIVTTNVSGSTGTDAPLASGVGAGVGEPMGAIEYVRRGVDELFYTVIYTIAVYMIGMSAFKLIDGIPNNILRWMGSSVSTFGEHRKDAAENLVSMSFIGSSRALGQVSQVFGGQGSFLSNLFK